LVILLLRLPSIFSSFGVVMLELITGKKAVVIDEKFDPLDYQYATSLANWVNYLVKT
jgi:hypothetical protein